VYVFPGTQTHGLGVASTIPYQFSFLKFFELISYECLERLAETKQTLFTLTLAGYGDYLF